MKEPDYVMKIMASWMTHDKIESARTRIYFIDISGTNETKHFTHQQRLGLHFRYIYQAENHNIWRHANFLLERTCTTKLWPYRNFAWYLVVF